MEVATTKEIKPRRLSNGHLSDLFFNYDHDNARKKEGDKFTGYDDLELLANARDVLNNVNGILDGFGCVLTYTPEELVADFYSRL